jgi:hypothetical protein
VEEVFENKVRWQFFRKGNLKAPLGGASHPYLDELSKKSMGIGYMSSVFQKGSKIK